MEKQQEDTPNLKEELVLIPPPPPTLPPRLTSERLKRDEWSEGEVLCLLDAYESKWVLRNRAKLKGHDWEDVAREVSSRGGGGSCSKTATQCKNKIESMKKRYRNESVATGSRSSLSKWPLFSRIDGLVRWRAPSASTSEAVKTVRTASTNTATSLMVVDHQIPSGLVVGTLMMPPQSPEINGVEAPAEEAGAAQDIPMEGGDRIQPAAQLNKEADQNVPSDTVSSKKNNTLEKKTDKKRKMGKQQQRQQEGWEVVESIQWLAEVVLRVEQSRMEAMREVEKIRAQTEVRKGEMDLKRTEIIANTQLQIARLIARSSSSSTRKPDSP